MAPLVNDSRPRNPASRDSYVGRSDRVISSNNELKRARVMHIGPFLPPFILHPCQIVSEAALLRIRASSNSHLFGLRIRTHQNCRTRDRIRITSADPDPVNQ